MHKKFLILGLSSIFLFGTAIATTSLTNDHSPTENTDQSEIGKDLIGRWDITVDNKGKQSPSWLEVKLSGSRTLVGSFVGIEGSARPVSKIEYKNGKFSFAIPPQWESGDRDFVLEGELTNKGIKGTMITSQGEKLSWEGVKAPYLQRTSPPKWGQPIDLFNGKNLTGWKALGENQWVVKNGILTNPRSGSNLISDRKFEDFKLLVEFRYPKGSNSGVYLRGRYEVQIEDSPKDAYPSDILFSGVYGFIAPSEINTLGPDQWQTFEITLVGRMVTIVANGKTVITNQEIPGITGGALDSNEGEMGPIYIQGDHGAIEFRKIVVTPAL